MARCIVAVDVGGTFTDVSLATLDDGSLWSTKTPTTPDDQGEGFATGLVKILHQAGCLPTEVVAILHGSTVATNMIIERKGSPLALLTTHGCRYVLHIGRPDVPKGANMYLWMKPPRLVTPEHIYEIPECLDHAGNVLQALDEQACIQLLKRLHAERAPALAVSLLHAYANPLHAGRLAALLDIPTVIIPRHSGVLSTLGLLSSDIKNDYVRTVLQRHNAFDLDLLNTAFAELEAQARHRLTEEGVAPQEQHVQRSADMRYANQG